jgi:putative PIN family toxin of toxin-antitoxin system
MIRAVVDTNVYVSALVFGGVPALALQLAELGVFQLVASQEIHEELVATLTGKFGWTKDRSESACRNLWQEAHWVVPSQNVHASRDPDDDYILACALESQAAFVTGPASIPWRCHRHTGDVSGAGTSRTRARLRPLGERFGVTLLDHVPFRTKVAEHAPATTQ